jgi:hypothetical protein
MNVLAGIDPCGFPGQHVGHEHNSTFDAGQPFAAVHPLVDNHIVYDKNFP